MFKTIEAPVSQDLAQFSRLLWQRKISHRIVRMDQVQVLAVPREENVASVQSLYRQWLDGSVRPDAMDSTDIRAYFNPGETLSSFLLALIRTPLTIFIVVVCVVLSLLSGAGSDAGMVNRFLYPDFSFGGSTIFLSRVVENFTLLQFLNMISPILMHSGFIHIAFNMLWFWEFGKRIEAVQASWTLLLLIVVVALVSNTVQYLYGGSIYFVGMSGVVYGLLGYIWMWQLFDPDKHLALPPAMIFIMLIFLVLMSYINLEFVADAAHIAGLLCGVLYGAVTATASRVHRALKVPGRG
ncbi:MAG: rhomboid family intramembrane serine protease [Pseudohongiellaceae bacterium]